MYTRRTSARFTPLAIAVVLGLLIGCSDQSTGPSTDEFNVERKAVAEKASKKKGKGKAVAKSPAAAVEAPSEGGGFGAVDEKFVYDPRVGRDPFRSFEWERLSQMEEDAELRGPLEQFDVSQLSLVAIVWDTGNARALVQDPSGGSYIIGKGTRIGKNQGRVIKIDDNLVVVKETYVDFLGEETTKDIEMRIRRSQGG